MKSIQKYVSSTTFWWGQIKLSAVNRHLGWILRFYLRHWIKAVWRFKVAGFYDKWRRIFPRFVLVGWTCVELKGADANHIILSTWTILSSSTALPNRAQEKSFPLKLHVNIVFSLLVVFLVPNVAQSHANENCNQTRHEYAEIINFFVYVIIWTTCSRECENENLSLERGN